MTDGQQMRNCFDSNLGFFQAFTNSRRLSRLTRLDFSAGEFPESGKCYTFRSLPDQETATLLDDSDSDAGDHDYDVFS